MDGQTAGGERKKKEGEKIVMLAKEGSPDAERGGTPYPSDPNTFSPGVKTTPTAFKDASIAPIVVKLFFSPGR